MGKLLIVGIVLTCCVLCMSSDDKITFTKTLCDHDKLKIVDDMPWAFELNVKEKARSFWGRGYKCKDCKTTLFIQQAVELPELKCEKVHLDNSSYGIGDFIITQ